MQQPCPDLVTITNHTDKYYVWVTDVTGSGGAKSSASPVVGPGKYIDRNPFSNAKLTEGSVGTLIISEGSDINGSKEHPIETMQFAFPKGGYEDVSWTLKDGTIIKIGLQRMGKHLGADTIGWLILIESLEIKQ